MNRRLITIILIALGVAGSCAYVVYRIAAPRMGPSKAIATMRVVAAAGNIKIGSLLTPSDLTTIEIAGTLPKGAILKPENALGRGVVSSLYQGEPILEDRLAPPGSGGGLAATIPDGMRACAVKVDDVVGVAGFVTPGMRVDVLISGVPPGVTSTAQGVISKTVLQNIEVLSAGTDIQKDGEGKPKQVQVVNLLVTPEQAETLSLASNHLAIQLILRNPLDTKINAVPGTAMGTLFSGENSTAAPIRPAVRVAQRETPKPFSIEMISGSRRSELKVGSPEVQK
jgi:pilus assembly protein CpaB